MTKRQFVLWAVGFVSLLSLACAELQAQYAAPPDAYSVSEVNAMMGTPVVMQIYRDGSKALVDQSFSGQGSAKSTHVRTLYDLKAKTSLTWDLNNASVPCGLATFSGDWGDPFAASAELNADLAKQHPNEVGSATLNGIPSKVLEAVAGVDGKSKLWVDTKFGLIVRWITTGKGGAQTMIEVKKLDLSKPDPSVFALPPACAQAAKGPRPQTAEERIVAATGGNSQDYADATMPPASKNSCTVLFKVVRAGSMEPITNGFQVAVDKNVDVDHLAHYVMGAGANGKTTFSGGGLHEETAQMRDGVLRIDNAPAQFDVELAFGKGGYSSALIYRQCFAPQTTLLLVVKSPDKLSDGTHWLWVKPGKHAALAK
jgi:hypothetical protein